MRIIYYMYGSVPYDMVTRVEVCRSEEEYMEAIAFILRNDEVRSVNVCEVKEVVELTRLELRKNLRVAAGVVDGFGEEGAILKKAMVDKALWSIRRLALRRIEVLQGQERIKELTNELFVRKGKKKK